MGIMFSYVQISVVYIRNTLRPGTGAKRRGAAKGRSAEPGSSDPMIEAGAPSTGEVAGVLSGVCPPHRGWSWSHHPRSHATLQGRNARAALGKIGNKPGNSAAKGSIEAGAP
jgi:hypothetical protein